MMIDGVKYWLQLFIFEWSVQFERQLGHFENVESEPIFKKKSTKLRTEIFNSNNKTSINVRVPAVTLLISFIGIDRVISMHKNPLWVTSKHISFCLFCFSMRRTNKLQI